MQTIKLNLIPGSVLPVVNVSQYDKTRQFALQVYEGATAYSLTGKSVQIRGTKPDGNGFAYDATDGVVSVSGSTVTISTTQQMTAVGGQTMAELRITSGQTILGTLNFIIDVEPSALSDDTPISDTDIPAIERDFEAALAEAEADALVAEGYAKGTQGGVPVGSGSPYYNNNAEHFKDEAEEAASDVLEKYPKIVSDYWYVWDIDTSQYVNTGVRAKGTQGDPGEGVPAGGTTGQVLRKKSGTDYDTEWANGGGGASALDDLTDVTITSAADGDLLQYDATGQKWVNSAKIPQKVAGLQKTGCVNLFDNKVSSQVVGGVTVVANGDKSVTLNGTSTENIIIPLNTDFSLPIGRNLIWSSGKSLLPSNVYLTVKTGTGSGSSGDTVASCDNRSYVIPFTVPNVGAFHAYLWIGSGVTFNNYTIYPMASYFYADYQPYSMTNRELTEAVTGNKVLLTLNSGYRVDTRSDITIKNGVCYFTPCLYADAAFDTLRTLVTIGSMPSGVYPRAQIRIPCYYDDATLMGTLFVNVDGSIKYYPITGSKYFGFVNAVFLIA